MLRTESLPMEMAQSASRLLKAAHMGEPHPLHPRKGEVVEYVRQVQLADAALALALDSPQAAELPAVERDLLRRKRAAADSAIARQASLAARRMSTNRAESLDILNTIFKLGSAPRPPLDGRCKGQLVTTTLFGPLDSYGRLLSRVWMPWKGKRFNADASSGDNLLTTSMLVYGRIYWPTFTGYRPHRPGLYTAFDFRTYEGPGVGDPEISTLKLDYDSPVNPSFLVRSVLDELVQITGNYYLGKAYLRTSGGRYRLAAFFALQKES